MTDKNQVTGLLLEIEGRAEVDANDLDSALRRLRSELLELDVEHVKPVQSKDLPEGAKGDGVLVGMAIGASLTALPGVFLLAQQWLQRQQQAEAFSLRFRVAGEVIAEITSSKPLTAENIAALTGKITIIHTGGGAYVGGDVTTGGNFTGRDSIKKGDQ